MHRIAYFSSSSSHLPLAFYFPRFSFQLALIMHPVLNNYFFFFFFFFSFFSSLWRGLLFYPSIDTSGSRQTPDTQDCSREKQYKDRLASWHIRKNIKAKEAQVMLRKQQKRAARGKQTAFRVNGQEVDAKRIARFARRHGTNWENHSRDNPIQPSPEPGMSAGLFPISLSVAHPTRYPLRHELLHSRCHGQGLDLVPSTRIPFHPT